MYCLPTKMGDIEDFPHKKKSAVDVDPAKIPKLKLIVKDMCKETFGNKNEFMLFRTTMQRKYKMAFNTSELVKVYLMLKQNKEITANSNFESFCKVKGVREQQGVIVITVVMSPTPNGQLFTCKWNCHYCPNVEGYARSYFPGEPAVDRGKDNEWDAKEQVYDRIHQYIQTGIMLPTVEDMDLQDIQGYKIDVVIEGGTYFSYPKEYRQQFIHDLFYACNVAYEKEKRPIFSLDEEKRLNETGRVRIIGMSIETRPDTVSKPLIKELRQLGVTRVQIGVQHLNDDVLRYINRQCYTKHTKRAIKILLDNGFKVAVHYMPDLPSSTPEIDLQMWEQLFTDPDLEFDYCKLYPCMTMPHTEILKWYEEGKYKPYADETTTMLVDGIEKQVSKIVPVCIDFMRRIKKHQRVERMLRDLPVQVQEAGCNTTNLRQMVENIMKANGQETNDIRYREVRDKEVDYSKAKMIWYSYPASGGIEYFIRFEDENEKILLGFIRLRIPDPDNSQCIEELDHVALIREIHVYGKSIGVGAMTDKTAQHRGYGTKLLEKAEEIAREHGFQKIAVISGEGVRGFYRKRGFTDGEFYMFKMI